jgi:hypothetical protein
MAIGLPHVADLEAQAARLTARIGSRRKYIHAAQNRAKNAVLGYLAPLARHQSRPPIRFVRSGDLILYLS